MTSRDRSAYANGAVAAADWLMAHPRQPGIHSFDEVVDDILLTPSHTSSHASNHTTGDLR